MTVLASVCFLCSALLAQSAAPAPAELPSSGGTGSRREPDVSAEVRPGGPTALPVIRLISEDPAAMPFDQRPLPRSSAEAADARLNDLCCVGAHCWAVGERGVIVKSEDAGDTWSTRLLPFECSLQSVCFLTSRVGWIAGTRFRDAGYNNSVAVLLLTKDAGETWTNLVPDPVTRPGAQEAAVSTSSVSVRDVPGFLKVAFFGLEEGIAVTLPVGRLRDATLLRTGDGGATWVPCVPDVEQIRFTTGSFQSINDGVVGG